MLFRSSGKKKVGRTRTRLNRFILLFVHRGRIGTIANAVENALELEWGTNCDSNARERVENDEKG